MNIYYAHTKEGSQSLEDWEPLLDHLNLVSQTASNIALRSFPESIAPVAAEWARLAGLWHDLGKYSEAFQQYLLQDTGMVPGSEARSGPYKVDHSTYGALHAKTKGILGWLLSFPIAGHHGGMPDLVDLVNGRFERRLPSCTPPAELLDLDLPQLPASVAEDQDYSNSIGYRFSFFVRMIYSCLVDADFLATESFMSPHYARERSANTPATVNELSEALNKSLVKLQQSSETTAVNQKRARVLMACRAAADLEPGFFSLTVPTGGGKTLSSLAFALDHAKRHALNRVIFAVPFTSIIEQNARVFRENLGEHSEGSILEHHMHFEPAKEDRWSRYAAENWDAPLIVTTTVQLYESLFANKPSKCRKLHSIAKSVIVLDEAQAIPVNLLAPTLAALKELVRNYGCTVVLCTATQPALHERDGFPIGIPEAREIISDVAALFDGLKRVQVNKPRRLDEDQLIAELTETERVLCIVHTKAAARRLYTGLARSTVNEIGESSENRSSFCLTTNMCAAHRTQVIDRIKQRIRDGKVCRVVSTSLIEAGVDIDFPLVYRAIAGLDSIAQAAGRCNREGAMPELGRVEVFETEERLPPFAKEAARDAMKVLARHDDPIAPRAIEDYFREHYWQKSDAWDIGATDRLGVSRGSVLECFQVTTDKDNPLQSPFLFNFRTAAERYRLITEDQVPVVVPWQDAGKHVVEELFSLRGPISRRLRQKCQRLAVSVRRCELDGLLARGLVIGLGEFARGYFVLVDESAYEESLGLMVEAYRDPETIIL